MISMHETIEWNAVIRVDRQFANFDFFPFSTLSCICPFTPLFWDLGDSGSPLSPFFFIIIIIRVLFPFDYTPEIFDIELNK